MFNSLIRGEFSRNVVKLASGTAVAQAAPLLVTPVLTRLYMPADFGEYGVFAALLLGISIVVSGRYEIAVPIPKSDRMAFDLLTLSILISSAASVLLLFAAVSVGSVAGASVASLLGVDRTMLVLLPFGVFAAALMQSCSYWLTRKARYGIVARTRSIHGLVTAALGVLFGWLGLTSGLVFALLLGYAVAAILLAHALLAVDRARVKSVTFDGLKDALLTYRDFPLLNGSNALLDAVRESGTLVVFTAMFGPAATGFLSQTLRVLRAPVSLIGQAVAQVYFPTVSKEQAAGRSVRRVTVRTIKGILMVSAPLYLLVFLTGPWLFSFVFGSEWVTSGVFARTLSPWLMLVLVLSSLSLLPVARNAQRQALGLNIFETGARYTGIVAGGLLGGAVGAVAGMAIAGLFTGGIQLGWYWRLSGDSRNPSRATSGDASEWE